MDAFPKHGVAALKSIPNQMLLLHNRHQSRAYFRDINFLRNCDSSLGRHDSVYSPFLSHKPIIFFLKSNPETEAAEFAQNLQNSVQTA